MKRRSLGVKTDFPLVKVHLRAWSTDLCDSISPFFAEVNQTPLLVPSKTLKERHLRQVRRAFRRRKERVTFVHAIPLASRAVVFDLHAERTSCANCGESAKTLTTRLGFLQDGKVVLFEGKPRYTPTPCPACNSVTAGAKPAPESSILQQ